MHLCYCQYRCLLAVIYLHYVNAKIDTPFTDTFSKYAGLFKMYFDNFEMTEKIQLVVISFIINKGVNGGGLCL